MTEAGAEFRDGLGVEMGDAFQRQGDAMSMHGSYDEYGQNDTADLVRSVALSSAKLWEEVFDRLRRLEEAQVELRAMLGRIEAQLPAGPANVALASGASSAPSWPDRAIAAAEPPPGDPEPGRTDLFLPGPGDEPLGTVGHASPRDAVDLLVGMAPGPVAPQPVDEEPATFFFPPAGDAPHPADPASSDAVTGWPGSDAIGTPGWTSPRTVRYDEGFTSRDVVGPPTEEVQAIDVTPPERTNAEYFGRHAAAPPPGFAVANDEPVAPVVGFEAPQVRMPEPAEPFDAAIDEQLQQAAQAVEASTVTGPTTTPAPPFGFATGADLAEQPASGFGAWGETDDSVHVPLVFAPGTSPNAPAPGEVPPPPPGFAMGAEVAPPPAGVGALGDDVPAPPPGYGSSGDVPPPPPGFAPGEDVSPPPPQFGTLTDDVPPPPFGFGTLSDDAPLPPPGFVSNGDVPPPPPGFGSLGTDVPPPPPGFSAGADMPPPPPGFAAGNDVPPPPPGFGTLGNDVPPPPPPGFSAGADMPPPPLGFSADPSTPAPPSGFAASDALGAEAPATPPPPPGFGTVSAPMAAPTLPPPPPGFATATNGQQAGARTPTMSGSIADDVLAISSITPEPATAAAAGAVNSAGNGNGHGPADDGPPPPITPDFFARAGRRRR